MAKKLLLLALLVGCQPEGLTPVGNYAGNEISTFYYNDHNYIQFDDGVGQSRVRAIVHDPDCHCLRKVEVNY